MLSKVQTPLVGIGRVLIFLSIARSRMEKGISFCIVSVNYPRFFWFPPFSVVFHYPVANHMGHSYLGLWALTCIRGNVGKSELQWMFSKINNGIDCKCIYWIMKLWCGFLKVLKSFHLEVVYFS